MTITTPGTPRWHALMAYPQCEARARAWLARRDVEAFFPVRREVRHEQGRAVENPVAAWWRFWLAVWSA